MKFFNFSELGSCIRPQGTPVPEESGSLASSGHATASKHAGRCPTSAKTQSAAHWRPGLPAISEDGVAAQVVEIKSKQMLQKKSPSKGGSIAKNNRYSSTNSSYKESRKNSAPVNVIIPTFSPTPFVF